MKIRVYRSVINSVPSVVVRTTDWGRDDLDAILRVGEPEVEIGGRFEKCRKPADRSNTCDIAMSMLGCIDSNDRWPDCQCDDSTDAGYSEDDDSFTVPCMKVKVRSGFPVMVDFSPDYFKCPQSIAKIWSSEVAERISRAVGALRLLGSVLSSEEETYVV